MAGSTMTWRQRRRAKRLTYCYKPGSVTHDDTMPFVFWKVKEAPRDWALEHRVDRAEGTHES
jgi:hypothetical protein